MGKTKIVWHLACEGLGPSILSQVRRTMNRWEITSVDHFWAASRYGYIIPERAAVAEEFLFLRGIFNVLRFGEEDITTDWPRFSTWHHLHAS